MNYTALQTELQNAVYQGLTDAAAATKLNDPNGGDTLPVTSLPTAQIIDATVMSEYDALSATEKSRYQVLVSCGTLNPHGTNTRTMFGQMFPVGTTTRTNLLALANQAVSRAVFLGLGTVLTNDVTLARSGRW